MFKIFNPADGSLICEEKSFSREEVTEAFAAARSAFPQWSMLDLRERNACLARFRTLLEEGADSGSAILSRETGKPVHQAKGEILASLARIDWFIRHSPRLLNRQNMSAQGDLEEQVTWEPLGVVGNISAWNFPFFIGINVIVPALISGNTVLYKPSEYSTGTGLFLRDLLHKAGVGENVFQAVTGTALTGSSLCEQNLGGMFFTGSVATGQRIADALAGRMIPSGFELGGKDPAYVCDDADTVTCVANIADGAFYNAGQSCCAVERVYVHESIYGRFIERFREVVQGLKVGDPEDTTTYMGPLTRKEQGRFLDAQVEDALSKGAKILVSGGSRSGAGNFYDPVVLTEVNERMEIMKKESFGPVIGIQKVADDAEALKLMNASELGLTASVHSASRERAVSLLKKTDAGTVYWNCCDRVSPELPWSGRKLSGLGSTLSEPGLKAFVQPKAWHLKSSSCSGT